MNIKKIAMLVMALSVIALSTSFAFAAEEACPGIDYPSAVTINGVDYEIWDQVVDGKKTGAVFVTNPWTPPTDEEFRALQAEGKGIIASPICMYPSFDEFMRAVDGEISAPADLPQEIVLEETEVEEPVPSGGSWRKERRKPAEEINLEADEASDYCSAEEVLQIMLDTIGHDCSWDVLDLAREYEINLGCPYRPVDGQELASMLVQYMHGRCMSHLLFEENAFRYESDFLTHLGVWGADMDAGEYVTIAQVKRTLSEIERACVMF